MLDRETLQARTDMPSPHTRTPPLTCALKISSTQVRLHSYSQPSCRSMHLIETIGGAFTIPHKSVELDIDIGADAKDWSAIQAGEKLKPVEMELRRIEEITAELVEDMEYLRQREILLRDTNESTNERVKWFALGTMGILVCLGAWQVIYLRAYFRLVALYCCTLGALLIVICADRSISSKLCSLRKSECV